MGHLKDLVKGEAVHQRRLEFQSYALEAGRMLVEGWLRDDRLKPGYTWDGCKNDVGVIHWLGVRLLLEGQPLTIVDAEAEMPGVPHDLCKETLDSVKRLVGLRIASGYSQAVFKRIGGPIGCNHLTHLIIAMGPAALHGYWAEKARTPRPLPASLEEMPGLQELRGSCRLWRKDGPLITEIEAAIRATQG